MLRKSILRAVSVLLGCVAAWGLAHGQQPAAPATVAPPTEIAPAQSALPPADAERYIIGPSDVIQVFVWRNNELTTTVPVRPDGKVSTPLVEDMIAVGKTPTQLARDIEAKLAEYIRSPQVSIIVTQPASLFSQVKVVGQVRGPKPLPYRSGMTVMDALLAVGGLSEFAAGNRAKIVREEDGKTIEIKVKADDLMNNGDMAQNRELRAGDVIVVPESRW